MYDEAVSALQRPLSLESGIGEAADGLTLWGGASVMGSPGDGSVQASILQVCHDFSPKHAAQGQDFPDEANSDHFV